MSRGGKDCESCGAESALTARTNTLCGGCGKRLCKRCWKNECTAYNRGVNKLSHRRPALVWTKISSSEWRAPGYAVWVQERPLHEKPYWAAARVVNEELASPWLTEIATTFAEAKATCEQIHQLRKT